jgi:stearoyl-CoA desaturase (Delta-9 desaturase)
LSTVPVTGAVATERLGHHRSVLALGIPFCALHLGVLAVIVVHPSPVALVVCALSYLSRTFGITAFYHRCFAHRAFDAPRPVRFVGALLGAAAAQQGPLWWVAHHRRHHRFTDRPGDPHSPVVSGFWWSHVGWIFAEENTDVDLRLVRDLAAYPELVLLDRHQRFVPIALGALCFGLGSALSSLEPGWSTNGLQLLVWGFVVPTVVLYHSTFAVNSIAHRFGYRRFATNDESRNNWVVALLTLGEGWHNNHHRYPFSARQGLARSEIDPTFIGIRTLAAFRLARDLRPTPLGARLAPRLSRGAQAPSDPATSIAMSAETSPA